MHFWCDEFYEGGASVRRPPVKRSTIAESLRNSDITNTKRNKSLLCTVWLIGRAKSGHKAVLNMPCVERMSTSTISTIPGSTFS
jgi:hypothetical protein